MSNNRIDILKALYLLNKYGFIKKDTTNKEAIDNLIVSGIVKETKTLNVFIRTGN